MKGKIIGLIIFAVCIILMSGIVVRNNKKLLADKITNIKTEAVK